MSENNEVFNPAGTQKEQTKSVGIKSIGGKEIFITGSNHTRGTPSKYTRADQIGTDGLTDYYTITTQESFDLPPKKGEPVEPINGFFVTSGIYKQLQNERIVEALAAGKSIGPVKAVKKDSKKNVGQEYWCLVFNDEEGYDKL